MQNPYDQRPARGEPINAYEKELDPGLATYEPALFSFDGRIGRVRYLGYSMILQFVALLACTLLVMLLMSFATPEQIRKLAPVLSAGLGLALLAIVIAVTKRRLNDLDRSGWWLLLWLIPLVNLLMALYVLLCPGDASHNSYGARPAPNSIGIVLLVVVPLMFSILCGIAVFSYVTSLPPGSLPPGVRIPFLPSITLP